MTTMTMSRISRALRGAALPGFLLLAMAAPLPALAQVNPLGPTGTADPTPAHLALAREVVELSGFAKSFDAVLPEFALRIRQNFAPTRPEIIKDLDDTLVALQPEVVTRRAEMIDRSARLFAARLGEADLRDIVAFFKSPAGQRYVASQPAILDGLFQVMQNWMQTTSDFLLGRVRQEMQKKGHSL
jgi:hypothetical protein